jgi:hypothetical protein
MKTILLLLAATSCAHFEYEHLYYADSAGTHKCQPILTTAAFNDFKVNEKEDWTEYTKHTGYSDCRYLERKEDVVITECKSPALYRSISSKKPAACHKFMADNDFQKVR